MSLYPYCVWGAAPKTFSVLSKLFLLILFPMFLSQIQAGVKSFGPNIPLPESPHFHVVYSFHIRCIGAFTPAVWPEAKFERDREKRGSAFIQWTWLTQVLHIWSVAEYVFSAVFTCYLFTLPTYQCATSGYNLIHTAHIRNKSLSFK